MNYPTPGQRIVISTCNGVTVAMERSGDGKIVRYVRESDAGFVVFKTVRV